MYTDPELNAKIVALDKELLLHLIFNPPDATHYEQLFHTIHVWIAAYKKDLKLEL